MFSSGGSIAATAFGDNGPPLVEGKCMMHRQASFFSAFFPDGTKFGEGPGEVSTFYFPADRVTRSWSAASAPGRSATLRRCGR